MSAVVSRTAAFDTAVWDFVRGVPRGQVVSYGQVAAAVGPRDGMDPLGFRREGPRLVGGALAACPDDVPWHRVVNARGLISYQGAAAEQRARLAVEGVAVVDGAIDLARHQWSAPGEAVVPAQHALF